MAKEPKEKKARVPKILKRPDYTEPFLRFWAEVHPERRTRKKDCFDLWKKLDPDAELVEKIVAGMLSYTARQKRNGTLGKFIKMPQTWLNCHGWDDDEPEKATDSALKRIITGW